MKINLPAALPDPERAQNNIETFLSINPDYADKLDACINPVSMLFSYSQFLANYSIKKPEALFTSLALIEETIEFEQMRSELKIKLSECKSLKEGMKAVRDFKKDKLLIITIRDILNRTGLEETMYELSLLADAILSESLNFVSVFLINRYGIPETSSLAVIGLGKLGPYELNYSSDVDLIFAYREEGETSGILSPQGMKINKISAFEFYSKIVEEYSRFLSSNTEDGFAYRVDLRLRPQGQRGSLVLSIRGYEEYYESWGQLWERAAMIRARLIAGDHETGDEFLKVLKPFIYRKYLSYDAIEEIRRLKSQVEQIKPNTLSRDIKRGFGGIREIEFFIQIFQIIYGGKKPLLRESSTIKALHRLLQKGLIGYEDFQHLSESYVFLRTVEHRLQQLNDIQTHTMPADEKELNILSRKMRIKDKAVFLAVLYSKRYKVRQIYDSLLEIKSDDSTVPQGDKGSYGRIMDSVFWEMDSPLESLIIDELSGAKIKNPKKAIHCLTKIRNSVYSFQTLRGRRLLADIIPKFVDEAIKGSNPDNALAQLVDFSGILAARESYLESISQRQEIISTLNFIFSNSEYLSKIIMNNPDYIDSLIVGESVHKSPDDFKKEIDILTKKHGISTSIRLFRRHEEIRLGASFLNARIGVTELMTSLSMIADIILSAAIESASSQTSSSGNILSHPPALSIIGFGKLGGMEITFNSDIDIIFICPDEPLQTDIKSAEKLIRIISSYTKDGIGYRVDIRLRPDGNKGTLISSLQGIEHYYLSHAQPWELQALLKARPLSSNAKTNRNFMEMRKNVLIKRAAEISKREIRNMCERMQRELSKESLNGRVFDIKYGAGGLAELEFFIQYLQLENCKKDPDILIQNTFNAIKKLGDCSFLEIHHAEHLRETYLFYRTIETLLKLRNESILREKSNTLDGIAFFLNTEEETFLSSLEDKRRYIKDIWERY